MKLFLCVYYSMISKEILYNPLLLYFFAIVSFGQLILLGMNQEWFYIGMFIIVCLVTSVFSKNLIVISVIGLVVLQIFRFQYKPPQEEEGFKRRRRRRRRKFGKKFKKGLKKYGKYGLLAAGPVGIAAFAAMEIANKEKERKRKRRERRRRERERRLREQRRRDIESNLNNRI